MNESGAEYRELKADQQDNVTRAAGPSTFRLHPPNRTRRRFVGTRTGKWAFVERQATPEDYSAFKATAMMATFAEDIKQEIRDQHQQTRADVQQSRHDILAAIKSSPTQYVMLVSEIGSVLLLFALLVRFVLKIELVNTAFALFVLFSLGFYWVMASLKRASEKRSNNKA